MFIKCKKRIVTKIFWLILPSFSVLRVKGFLFWFVLKKRKMIMQFNILTVCSRLATFIKSRMEILEISNLFQMEFLKYEYTMVLDIEFIT